MFSRVSLDSKLTPTCIVLNWTEPIQGTYLEGFLSNLINASQWAQQEGFNKRRNMLGCRVWKLIRLNCLLNTWKFERYFDLPSIIGVSLSGDLLHSVHFKHAWKVNIKIFPKTILLLAAEDIEYFKIIPNNSLLEWPIKETFCV